MDKGAGAHGESTVFATTGGWEEPKIHTQNELGLFSNTTRKKRLQSIRELKVRAGQKSFHGEGCSVDPAVKKSR